MAKNQHGHYNMARKELQMKDYMKIVSIKEAVNSSGNETLCWDCAKATTGGCNWTNPNIQEPVEGWKAVESDMGYCVLKCPEFERHTYGGCRYRNAEDYIEALENEVRSKTEQVQNLKKTLWWKKVYTLKRKLKEAQTLCADLRMKLKEERMKNSDGSDC